MYSMTGEYCSVKQLHSMFPSVCSVADHRCVKIWYEQKRVNLYHILTSSGTITRTVPTCVYASILEKLIDKNQSNFS